jgi:hypothetical protein
MIEVLLKIKISIFHLKVINSEVEKEEVEIAEVKKIWDYEGKTDDRKYFIMER